MPGVKKLNVLVLTHKYLIPPEDATIASSINQDWKAEFDVSRTLKKLGHDVKLLGVDDDLREIRDAIEEWKPQIAFNLLEEFAGESIFDQHVVSYLELLKLPYTGSGSRGLMLTRDKALTKKILTYHRILVPQFSVFRQNKKIPKLKNFKFPLIVKSLTEESSTGISQASVVYDYESLQTRIGFVHNSVQTDAIAETFIEGKELYVGVIGNKRIEVFPVWEMVFKDPNSQMEQIATHKVKWDAQYRAKYGITTRKATGLTEEQIKHIQSICKRSYKALGISGYARMDLRFTPEGRVYLIEANPNPNIEEGEDFAASAERVGYKYKDLLQKIIKLGLNWDPTGFR